MDYDRMAQIYMQTMYQMRKRSTQKQIHDSMHGESFILFVISQNEGKVIPSDISNEMGITSARVAAALNNLEAKGLIIRRIDIEDRRRIIIELTDLGKEQVQKQYKKIMGMVTNMLKYLGEEDTIELIRILKKLALKEPDHFL